MKKKIICLCLLLILFSIDLFAGEILDIATGITKGTSSIISDSKAIAEHQKYNYKKQISDLILHLPKEMSKEEFYNDYKKSPLIPAFANLFIGFGVGSS